MSAMSGTQSPFQPKTTATKNKASTGGVGPSPQVQLLLQAPVESGTKLNPFDVGDDIISPNIIGFHDSQAVRHNVDYLYGVANNIVRSSTQIGGSLDLKRAKSQSIELVEEEVPENSLKPSYSVLKEIACQMTCKPFDTVTAHESVVGILDKLRSYTWDAKAVMALTAFALDFGETWRLSLMQAKKENTLELHVFRLAEEEKPHQDGLDLITTLIDRTLKLIEGIIQLEKWINNKAYTKKDVPTLYNSPRELYTYWTILALLACSHQMIGLDRKIKKEMVGRLNVVLRSLEDNQEKIKDEIEQIGDFAWRLSVFETPSGIIEFLKALIFPRDTKQLDIYDNTAHELVDAEVLKTKNILLFISGLDNIEDEILALKPIHDSLTKDKDKKDYKILWVPVVEEWGEPEKKKFEHLTSLMPWYVVQYFSPIKGITLLREKLNYQGKPIVVVANARGEIITENALHMIFVWGIQAFPFRPENEAGLSLHWNWFWNEAIKINAEIEQWVKWENKYVFFYGGTDIPWTQNFGTLVDNIKRDPIMKETDTCIEQFNLAKVDSTTKTKFWANITNSLLSKVQTEESTLDSVLLDIQNVLSMRTQEGWALVSKGENVLFIGYSDLVMGVVRGFDEWRNKVSESHGLDVVISEYYESVRASLPVQCVHFQLDNIRSNVPTNLRCFNPSCGRKLEIESVNYKCCHGMPFEHVAQNGDIEQTPVKKNVRS